MNMIRAKRFSEHLEIDTDQFNQTIFRVLDSL